jgi:hypothetical protein
MLSLNAIRPVVNIPAMEPFVFDPENDTIGNILGYVCKVIEDTNAFDFMMLVGTKTMRLPISVALEIFLEQLPDALQALRNPSAKEFLLEFYEQGMEMRLIFRKDEENVCLHCEDRRRFVRGQAKSPEIESGTFDARSLESNLLSVATVFLAFSDEFCADIASLPDFLNWRQRLFN